MNVKGFLVMVQSEKRSDWLISALTTPLLSKKTFFFNNSGTERRRDLEQISAWGKSIVPHPTVVSMMSYDDRKWVQWPLRRGFNVIILL